MLLQPRPVSHTNFEELKPYFKYADKHMSLAQFCTSYLWRYSTGLLYDIQDDFLFLFEKRFNYASPLPLGEGDIYAALDKVKKYKEHIGGNNLVYCISQDKLPMFEERYETQELPHFFEYVYLAEDLINLTGKRFSAKRNHINYFLNNYEYEYKNITSADVPVIMDLLDKWNENKELSVDLISEKRAIDEILNYDIGVDFKSAFITVEGRPVAFSIGRQIADDMACVYFEKADVNVRGSYAIINQQFVKNEFPDVKYINRQEDMGSSGLIKAKRSYNPVFQVKNYSLKL